MSPTSQALDIRAHILVVEDSQTQALQLRRLLEAQGLDVTCVLSAEAALDALNDQELPDLVVADYHLPGMNGDELSRQLRLNMRTRAIPVVMLTEANAQGLERQGLESGADAYIPKSADRELVLLRIRALLRQRGPAATQADAGRVRRPTTFTPFRRVHVLIGDQDTPQRAELEKLLGREGYVIHAFDRVDALLAAVDSPAVEPDAVVVNVSNPAFDGFALCRALNDRRDGETPDMARYQLVALTDGDEEAIRNLQLDAFSAGADDAISVASDADMLKLRLRTLVRRKLVYEENQRLEAESRAHDIALERARVEAAAAEALARANADLEAANRALQETQSQLIHSAQMASLGELVAGIAHEINNPLAFILAHHNTVSGLLESMKQANFEEDAFGEKLDRSRLRLESMGVGLKRIQDLILKLRKFSRLDEGEFQKIDVPEALDLVLALLAHKIGTDIKVETALDAPPPLLCSPALINQALMNIIGNAADALGGSGTIRIATNSADGRYVFRVEDDGPGIPAELRERIFEPFFTTKEVGAGTGLGLAIAYRIVMAHHGEMRVETSASGGAAFVLSIPLEQRA